MPSPDIIGQIEQAVKRRDERKAAAWTPEDIAELVAFNEECGNAAGALAARELANPQTLCVLTGQQAGLLCGPLYTLYKALGALVLAEKTQERLERPVVAGFWVASDDHDFNEIRSVVWQDKDDAPRRFDFRTDVEAGAVSAHAIPLGDGLKTLWDEIEASTHPGELRDTALRRLREAAEASANLEDFFCRCLAILMGVGSRLMFVSPRLRCVRTVQSTALAPEFKQPLRSTSLLLESGKAFEARGEKPPIHRRFSDVNCFLYEGAIRAHLSFADGRFVASHPVSGGRLAAYSQAEMNALLESSPERFSPNVATRPIAQDARFPTIAYVAGPGEEGYFSQIAPLYEFFSVGRPAVIRRPGGVLVEPRVTRALEQLGVGLEEYLRLGSEALMAERAKAQSDGATARVERTARQVEELIDSLSAALQSDDPAIVKGLERLRGTVGTAFGRLEQRAIAAQTRDDQIALERCRRIDQSLRPWGQPQERVYTAFVPYYIHYGDALARFLESRFADDFTPDRIVYLKEIPGYSDLRKTY